MKRLAGAMALAVRAAPASMALRVGTTLLSGAAPVGVAWLTRNLIDDLARPQRSGFWLPACALAVAGALLAVNQHVARFADREVARQVALSAQTELFAAVTRPVGIAELEDPAGQNRLRLAQQAGQEAPQQLTAAVLAIGQAAVTLAGFLVALAALSPLIAVLVAVSGLPVLVAQIGLSRRRAETTVRITPGLRRQAHYAMLLMDVRAAKEIRLFGLGPYFRSRLARELAQAQDAERAVDKATLRVDGLLAVLTAAVSGGALVAAIARIGGGAGTVGDLSVLIAALAGVQSGLATMVSSIATADQMLILYSHYAAVVESGATGSAESGDRSSETGSATRPASPSPPPAHSARVSNSTTSGSATPPTATGSCAGST
ncbi:hypothetical protein ACFQ9X_35180 [Catenulispora yoronensis]